MFSVSVLKIKNRNFKPKFERSLTFFVASSHQLGWDRKYTLKEADFHESKLPDDIGVKWKDLARALGFKQAFIDITEKEKIHCARESCIEVLVCWLHMEGKEATAEKIFEALVKIRLRNLAERFPCRRSDPSQVIHTDICRGVPKILSSDFSRHNV